MMAEIYKMIIWDYEVYVDQEKRVVVLSLDPRTKTDHQSQIEEGYICHFSPEEARELSQRLSASASKLDASEDQDQ